VDFIESTRHPAASRSEYLDRIKAIGLLPSIYPRFGEDIDAMTMS
jgi:hypothetical protein